MSKEMGKTARSTGKSGQLASQLTRTKDLKDVVEVNAKVRRKEKAEEKSKEEKMKK